jgi:hypothetical protein
MPTSELCYENSQTLIAYNGIDGRANAERFLCVGLCWTDRISPPDNSIVLQFLFPALAIDKECDRKLMLIFFHSHIVWGYSRLGKVV